jgi:hypothetical protein
VVTVAGSVGAAHMAGPAGRALLLLRDETGVHLHAVPPPVASVPLDVAPDAWRAWNPKVVRGIAVGTVARTGRRLVAVGLATRTWVVDADTGTPLVELAQGAEEIAFSPQGRYVSTWRPGAFSERKPVAAPGSALRQPAGPTVDFRLEDPKAAAQLQTVRTVFARGSEHTTTVAVDGSSDSSSSNESGGLVASAAEDKENLSVWRVSDGALLASFAQRTRERWAPQWTEDESLFMRTVTNTLQLFRQGDFGPAGRATLAVERVAAAALAPVRGAWAEHEIAALPRRHAHGLGHTDWRGAAAGGGVCARGERRAGVGQAAGRGAWRRRGRKQDVLPGPRGDAALVAHRHRRARRRHHSERVEPLPRLGAGMCVYLCAPDRL